MPCLFRAENEIRTRDPQLGKLMLYQLSYFRFYSLGSQYLLSLIPLGSKGQNYTLRSNKPNQIYRKFISTAE